MGMDSVGSSATTESAATATGEKKGILGKIWKKPEWMKKKN